MVPRLGIEPRTRGFSILAGVESFYKYLTVSTCFTFP
ncbi:MAG: hypothetical protein ACI8XG_001244, partial [Congregibacter sp.]